MLGGSNEGCSTEGSKPEQPVKKTGRAKNPHVFTMLKVVELWDAMIVKLDPQDKKFLVNRIKYLREKHMLSEGEILQAVANYGRSEWHISTGAWKKPLAFLTSDNIRKWQKTAEEQNSDRLAAFGRKGSNNGNIPDSLSRILSKYKTHHNEEVSVAEQGC